MTEAFGRPEIPFKTGPMIRFPPGHDPEVKWHTTIWGEDCHCQGHHFWCMHILFDAEEEETS